ncbi:MAG: hypothetical protein HY791_00735 [Deltaproteobacteria bacterium]|nr:hypothetical protein [Deltaproteobacteria bacterium]
MDFGQTLSPKWIRVKAAMFIAIAVSSTTLLLLERPDLKTAFLLGCTIWGSCRAYYFVFYALEKYVDAEFRYSGLFDLARHSHKRHKRHERA